MSDLPFTTCDLNGEVRIRMGSTEGGEANQVGSSTPETVPMVFERTVKEHPDAIALSTEVEGEWSNLTWTEYHAEVMKFAKSLISIGFEAHKAINIIGFNSKEWLIANNGAIFAGGVAVGIYTTNLTDACKYITDHSEAEVVVAENWAQAVKFTEIAADLPKLKRIVIWNDDDKGGVNPEEATKNCSIPVNTWGEFLNLGANVPDAEVKARCDALKPGHCCTLIYTSGTTGPPKAVMISHDNLTWTVANFLNALPFDLCVEDRSISFLPLSHVAAQMLDIHCPMATGNRVYFGRPDALKGSIKDTLVAVRPTFFFAVPRLWEKMYDAMQIIGKKTTGIKKIIATWAKGLAAEKNKNFQYGGNKVTPNGFACAHALILSKIKAGLGMDQLKVAITSAAPISPTVLNYFASLDIQIHELFGQSECTGPHTSNFDYAWKIGSIGRDLINCKSKVDKENNEFCMYGRHIMMGYLKMPEKTIETIDPEGWLHSGDIATADKDGFWSITGRIKELIITAGGENVPPVLIEHEFKKAMPAISNCMVLGDKRPFLSILLAVKTQIDMDAGLPTNKLAPEALEVCQTIGSTATTVEEVKADPKWAEYFNQGMRVANEQATSRAQKVAKWTLLPEDFSEKHGDLTPTMKLKRSEVYKKYERFIVDEIYDGVEV
jgi:long-chain-fatty-acid--CoA ligase ACSBG